MTARATSHRGSAVGPPGRTAEPSDTSLSWRSGERARVTVHPAISADAETASASHPPVRMCSPNEAVFA